MRRDLELIRGRTYPIIVRLLDTNKQPYILNPADKIIFGLKKSYSDEEYLIKKIITDAAEVEDRPGCYDMYIQVEDTQDLPFGNYVYDLGLQKDSGEYYTVIPPSNIRIAANVTEKE